MQLFCVDTTMFFKKFNIFKMGLECKHFKDIFLRHKFILKQTKLQCGFWMDYQRRIGKLLSTCARDRIKKI